jgi:hypothetical protein
MSANNADEVGGCVELKQLKYFLCVAEAGSFSKAAVMLSLTQPVLSRQVKFLEDELGEELFYRNGRGIVLSAAGKVLASSAKWRHAAPSRVAPWSSRCHPRSAGS